MVLLSTQDLLPYSRVVNSWSAGLDDDCWIRTDSLCHVQDLVPGSACALSAAHAAPELAVHMVRRLDLGLHAALAGVGSVAQAACGVLLDHLWSQCTSQSSLCAAYRVRPGPIACAVFYAHPALSPAYVPNAACRARASMCPMQCMQLVWISTG